MARKVSAKTLNMREATNENIARAIWQDASQEYQYRIPAPDQGDISQTFKMLQQSEYRPQLNEFVDTLVNRIGEVIFKSKTWKNPLSIFKRGMLYYGDTIEEIATNLIKAKRFDPNECYKDVFKCAPPDLAVNFHQANRMDRYDLSINQPMLRRAFVDNTGLSTMLDAVLATPYTSDEVDEYLIMRNLFTEMAAIDGYYKVTVPDVTSARPGQDRKQAAETVTETIRGFAGRLKFMNGQYNSAGVPTFSKPEELVLFCTPEFAAALDVNVIAFAFNASAADVRVRIIEIDDFGIDGCQAILADENIFVVADTLISFESIYNPKGLAWIYYLHHHGVYSMSRFVNAIMFTTEAGTVTTVPSIEVTGVTVSIAPLKDGTTPAYAEKGKKLRMHADVTGTVTPETPGYSVPQGVAWTISATDGIPLKQSTFIDAEGVLHVAPTEQNTKVTIMATSVYIDPLKAIGEQVHQNGTLVVGIGASATDNASVTAASASDESGEVEE